MAVPIYKLYLIKPRLEVYLVSEQQRSDMIGIAADSLVAAGGRSLLVLNLWSDGRYPIGGLEEFPDLHALREHQTRLREMLWPQYIESQTVLGISGPWSEFIEHPPAPDPAAPPPIFRLWVSRTLPGGYDSTTEDWEQYNKVNALAKEMGILSLMAMDCRLFDERWHTMGAERIPSIEAAQKVALMQESVKWWKFSEGRAYLGDAVSGLWSLG